MIHGCAAYSFFAVRWTCSCDHRTSFITKTMLTISGTDCLLLLGLENLGFDGNNLSQHNNSIPVHEGNTRKSFAVLERISDQRLLRLERTLSHLVRFQSV